MVTEKQAARDNRSSTGVIRDYGARFLSRETITVGLTSKIKRLQGLRKLDRRAQETWAVELGESRKISEVIAKRKGETTDHEQKGHQKEGSGTHLLVDGKGEEIPESKSGPNGQSRKEQTWNQPTSHD